MIELDITKFKESLLHFRGSRPRVTGRVTGVTGMVIKTVLPRARLNDVCKIWNDNKKDFLLGEVLGFEGDTISLACYDRISEVGPGTIVENTSESLLIEVGKGLLGRVLNSVGKPIDSKPAPKAEAVYPVKAPPPKPMERRRINQPIKTGVRAIDLLTTTGEGQRIGIFSSAGVGKSSMLGMIAKNSQADVNVIALVGERGREVRDFINDNLGTEGLKRSVVIVSTSDEPPLRRILAAYTATTIAEYFRNSGLKVMLLMDSLTRFARGLREIALTMGEPPARQGFPPSVFAALPELLERAGATGKGSITAFYTVLLSSEQIEDPLGEEIRAILDGHIHLSSKLAQSQFFPALDPLKSTSRLMNKLVTERHLALAEKIKRLWSVYEDNKDLILLGAYKKGTDREIDEALLKRSIIRDLLTESENENDSLDHIIERATAFLG